MEKAAETRIFGPLIGRCILRSEKLIPAATAKGLRQIKTICSSLPPCARSLSMEIPELELLDDAPSEVQVRTLSCHLMNATYFEGAAQPLP